MTSLTDSYVSLSAATRGTTLEGAQTREIFEAISLAMSSLGKSSADTEGALQAITQIVSKGVVSMEELRQQLGERVPGAFQIAADSMGLTTQELNELVASGELLAKDFLPAFAAGIKDTFGDVEPIDGFQQSMARLSNNFAELLVNIGDTGAFDKMTEVVELSAGVVESFADAVRFVTEAAENLANVDIAGSFGVGDFAKALSNLLDPLEFVKQVGGEIETSLQGAGESGASSLEEIVVTAKRIPVPLEEIVVTAERVENKMLDSAGAINKLNVELEKIASNERIKAFESLASIEVANVEADAKKVVSAFESIGVTAKSTGDQLSDLFGLFGNENVSKFDKFRVQDQIELENQRRQDALDLQERLTNAQIRALNARTEAMRSGGALVTINGDGLQPHLEAFMYEVLEGIQVRMNAEGLDTLLGVS